MPILFSWSLRAHGPAFFACGIVSGHPKLPEGEDIHTSSICRITEAEDYILLATMSGSIYPLALEELAKSAGGPELPPAAELGLSPDFWDRCFRAREQAAKKEEDALRALNAPGTLRLRIVGTTVLSALWSGPDGQLRRIPVRVHLGLFQDSVLVMELFDDTSGFHRVDFRYFPYPNQMVSYSISEEIKTILIVNEGLQDIPFGRRGQEVLCPAGETTRISVTHYPNRRGFETQRF